MYRSEFIKSATRPGEFPTGDKLHLAVAGRSNVGKSSLINRLLGRKQLARVSSTPGATRLINFFEVDGRFYLVDLPGYGYAKRSKAEREDWRRMVESYLTSSDRIVAMLVLIDLRRGPEEEERQLLETLKAFAIAPIVVLTKSDKLAKSKRNLAYASIRAELADSCVATILFSSKTGLGAQALRREVDKWVTPPVT